MTRPREPRERGTDDLAIELFDVTDRGRLSEALAIRLRVFVDEQRFPIDDEIDEHDRDDRSTVHALVRPRRAEAAAAIAAGRFVLRPGGRAGGIDASAEAAAMPTAQIGRMAVVPEARGRGVGAALLRALIAEAVRRGCGRAALNAQMHAVAFYRKLGFRPCGSPLLDAGVPHQPMERPLPPRA